MSRQQLYFGWLLAVLTPVLLWLSWRYVPYPGSALAGVVVLGIYSGFILYEHARARKHLPPGTVSEQLALAALLLVGFSFIL
ncbi:MAG: hypothetical protein WD467_03755 [Candidatus Saccharimonadales bacterium]